MSRPEIGKSINTGNFKTNYLEIGEDKEGTPLLFIHGSGPGVSAYANWRLVLPKIGEEAHVYAMDMIGFGFSDKPTGAEVDYGIELWTQQIIDFIEALAIDKVILVGNSFGGSLAFSTALKIPQKIEKIITMGTVGIEMDITYGLDQVWGYQGTKEHMANLVDLFTYNKDYASEELIQNRYEASLEEGFHEAFSSMFPHPRQQHLDNLSFPSETLKSIQQETLLIHGREDKVIPVSTSERLAHLLPNAQLHTFSNCGHWTQIEKSDEFIGLVLNFIKGGKE